jgi:hypothetical protein
MTFFVRDSLLNLFLKKPVDKQSPPATFHFIGRNSASDKNQKTKKERQNTMHLIDEQIDRVYSKVSREWHGKAIVMGDLNSDSLSEIMPPIVEGEISVNIDGNAVSLDSKKAIVADYRFRSDIPQGEQLVPLSIMGKDYRVIENREVFNAAQNAIENFGLDAEIVTAGTVRRGRSFFMSLQQRKSEEFEIREGDKWEFYLNLATSHDGTDALVSTICGFRQVCWNTVRASIDSSDVKVKIMHTKNADMQLDALPEILVAMRNKQTDMIEALAHLAGIKCDMVRARRIVSGYFSRLQNGNTEFATRTSNNVDGILSTFRTGKGNRGETLYDLVNGVTEFYTHGDGIGKTGSAMTKTFRSEFGSAAEHKERFLNMVRDSNRRESLEELGARVTLAPALAN